MGKNKNKFSRRSNRRDSRLTSRCTSARLCASVMTILSKAQIVATLGLPVFDRAGLAADGFPRFAFAGLFVKVL